MSKIVKRSLSLVLTVALIFTSVMPTMADTGYSSDTYENNNISYEEGAGDSISEQQEEDESKDASGAGEPASSDETVENSETEGTVNSAEGTEDTETEEPDNSGEITDGSAAGEPDGSDNVANNPDAEEPGEVIGEPNAEEAIGLDEEIENSGIGEMAYDPQPETLEDVQAAIDNYVAAEYDTVAKPHWEYEVDASLMPEGWVCVPVTGDEEFGADYYTISEIVQTGEIVITSEELVYYMGDRGEVDFMEKIIAVDNHGEDISEKLEVEEDGDFDTAVAGTYEIKYVIREGEDVIASHIRIATVVQTDITIHAEDAVLYASDYQESSGEVHEECGEVHETPDAETLRLMAMLSDVYGWDSNNCSVGNVQVIDDGGFTLERVEGEAEASFTVKYAVVDDNGGILAKTERVITVMQMKIAARAALGKTFGGDNANGSIRFVIDDTGYVQSLAKHMNGSYDTVYYYCVNPQFAWWIGDVEYASPYTTNGDWMHATYGNRLGSANSVVYSDNWDDAYDPTIVQTQTATMTWTKAWGNGSIDLVWVVSYVRGMGHFTHEWKLINNTGAALTDQVYLYYGGHHRLGGGTAFGWSHFDAVSNCIYTWKNTDLGMYIFRSDGAVEPTSYHGLENINATIAGWVRNREPLDGVPGGTNSYRDTGAEFHTTFYMQWKNSGSIANGATWRVEATEGCLNPGDISVIAPAAKIVPPGVTVSYSFTVMNMTIGSITVDLEALLDAAALAKGWRAEIDGANQITLNGISDTKTVTVNVTVPDTAMTGDAGTVTLKGAASSGFTAEDSATTTTVDENVAAITAVSVDRLTSGELDVKVDYSNNPGSHLTTVDVYSLDGTILYTSGSADISTGGVVTGIDVNMLTDGVTYRLRVRVEGIEYPHNSTTFVYRKNVTVSFESNGGSTVASQSVLPGSLVTKPNDPTRTGYTFDGWYKGTSLESQWSFTTDTVPASDTTLYAKWLTNLDAKYDANGGNGSHTVSDIKPGATHTVLSASTAGITSSTTGYIFDSWNTAANGSGTKYVAGAGIVMDSNVTLYAQWKHDGSTYYKVTYRPNGGTGSNRTITSLLPGSSYTIADPSAIGISHASYAFGSWNVAYGGTGAGYVAGTTIAINSDLNLYAQWNTGTGGAIDITYDANGGTGGTIVPVVSGAYHNLLDTAGAGIARYGYIFLGWSSSAQGSLEYTAGTSLKISNARIFYAVWEYDGATKANVIYDANGGTGGVTVTVKPGDEHSVLNASEANLARLGHEFLGWSETSTGSVDYAPGSTLKADNTITLYAVWEYDGSTTANVIYNANGGTGGSTITGIIPGNYHTVLSSLEASVQKTNSLLQGWSTSASGSVEYIAGGSLRVDGTITLYAVWEYDTSLTANIKYLSNDGDISVHEQNIQIGTVHTVLDISAAGMTPIPGLIFKGWNTEEDGSGVGYSAGYALTVIEDITLYAQWEHDGVTWYKVYYNANGGSGGRSENLMPGKYTVLTSVQAGVSRTNHNFYGWNTMIVGSGISYAEGQNIALKSNLLLYAQWIPDGSTTVSITYNANGGSGGTTATAATGSVHNVLDSIGANVTKTNYVLDGWNTAANGSGTNYAANVGVAVSNDMTLYAQWVHNGAMMNVTYDANGGTGGTIASVMAGLDHVVLDDSSSGGNVARLGHVFQGWSLSATGNVEYAAGSTMNVSSNTALYAVWAYDGFTRLDVSYSANGGAGGTTVSVIPGTDHVALSASGAGVSKLGYGLQGWSLSATGGVDYQAGSTIKVNDTVTLYAVWVYDGMTTVNVNYDANGGTGGTTVSVIPYSDHTVLNAAGANVAKQGYALQGWSLSANGSVVYAAGLTISVENTLILYAVWAYDNTVQATVTYEPNDEVGSSYIASSVYGDIHTVLSIVGAGITPITGLNFTGWNTKEDGSGTMYTPGETITISGDVTLYAQWVHDGVTMFKVIYNANGGSGSYQSAYLTPGSRYTILTATAAGISRSGYDLVSWNSAANGSGVSYGTGTSIVVTGNMTLYAQYQVNTAYKVTYDPNGGNGASYTGTGYAPGGVDTILDDVAVGISSSTSGLIFSGWNTAADGSGISYQAGSSITLNGDVMLYAQWIHDGKTWGHIYYRANGGTGTYNALSLAPGDVYTMPDALSLNIKRTGYTFTGWNTATNGSGVSYAAGQQITINGTQLTLYAQWTR